MAADPDPLGLVSEAVSTPLSEGPHVPPPEPPAEPPEKGKIT